MALRTAGIQWGRSTRSSVKEDDSTSEQTTPKVVDTGDRPEDMDKEPEICSKDDAMSTKSDRDGEDDEESEKSGSDSGLQASIDDLKDTINKLTASLKSVDAKFEEHDRRITFLYNRTQQLENENKYLCTKVETLENQRRILNIKLDGVKENSNEDLLGTVEKLVKDMGSSCKHSDIDSVYRLGRKSTHSGRPRSIVIRFASVRARHEFYNKRSTLKGKKAWFGVWINEDVLDVTRRKKDDMISVADLCRAKNVECKLHSDGIIIAGRKYGINDLATLPSPFTLAEAKFRELQPGNWYFQSEHVWPSNMHRTRVTVDKHDYETAEHAIQSIKAIANGDQEASTAIKKTRCPYEAKRIGDRVKTTIEWNKCQFDVLYEIIYEKVAQNPQIKEKPLATGDCRIHEATRSETFGIGAGLHSRAAREGTWRGKDIVGQIWEKIRDDVGPMPLLSSP